MLTRRHPEHYEKQLAEALWEYLRRAPKGKSIHSIVAYAELHTTAEIRGALSVLQSDARAEVYEDHIDGWETWRALTSQADCVACEVHHMTYEHPKNQQHTCMRLQTLKDRGLL